MGVVVCRSDLVLHMCSAPQVVPDAQGDGRPLKSANQLIVPTRDLDIHICKAGNEFNAIGDTERVLDRVNPEKHHEGERLDVILGNEKRRFGWELGM